MANDGFPYPVDRPGNFSASEPPPRHPARPDPAPAGSRRMATQEVRDRVIAKRAALLVRVQQMEDALRALEYAEKVFAQDERRRLAKEADRIRA